MSYNDSIAFPQPIPSRVLLLLKSFDGLYGGAEEVEF